MSVVVEVGVRAAEVVVMVAVGNAEAAIGLARYEAVVVQVTMLLVRDVAADVVVMVMPGGRTPIVTVPLVVGATSVMAVSLLVTHRTCRALPLTSG